MTTLGHVPARHARRLPLRRGAKAKLGLNWGESRLKDGAATDLRSNTNVTAGLYYGLTKSVTLMAELSRTTSKPVVGEQARMNGFALGGIVFF